MFNCTISVSIPEAGHYLIRDKALPYLCIPDNSQWLKSPCILSFLVVCLFVFCSRVPRFVWPCYVPVSGSVREPGHGMGEGGG